MLRSECIHVYLFIVGYNSGIVTDPMEKKTIRIMALSLHAVARRSRLLVDRGRPISMAGWLHLMQ